MQNAREHLLRSPRALAIGLGTFVAFCSAFFGYQYFTGSEVGMEGNTKTGSTTGISAAKVIAKHVDSDQSAESDLRGPNASSLALKNELTQEAKEAKLTDLVLNLRQYSKLWEELVKQAPGMKDFHGARFEWMRYDPDAKHPAQRKMIADLSKSKPELGKVLFKMMYLQRASVLIDMINDPNSQFYMKDVIEIGGAGALVPRELALLDGYANAYNPQSKYATPQTLEDYSAMLQSRLDLYAQATQQLASANGISQAADPQMLAYMYETMRKEITSDYLNQYHDTYFTGEIATMAAKIRQLTAEYEAFPGNLQVSSSLLNEYIKLAQTQATSTLADL